MPRTHGAAASAIVEQFERIARTQPTRPLIHLPLADATVTAEGLWDAAKMQARRLIALGLSAGDVLLYAAGNRPELLALWLAARAVGLALMPVDAGTTPE